MNKLLLCDHDVETPSAMVTSLPGVRREEMLLVFERGCQQRRHRPRPYGRASPVGIVSMVALDRSVRSPLDAGVAGYKRVSVRSTTKSSRSS